MQTGSREALQAVNLNVLDIIAMGVVEKPLFFFLSYYFPHHPSVVFIVLLTCCCQLADLVFKKCTSNKKKNQKKKKKHMIGQETFTIYASLGPLFSSSYLSSHRRHPCVPRGCCLCIIAVVLPVWE